MFPDKYAVAHDKMPYFIPTTSGYFKFDIQRLGLEAPGTYTVSVQPLTNISSNGPQKTFTTLNYLETTLDSIAFTLNPGILPGSTVSYLLSVSNGSIVHSDTIRKIYGVPVQVFNDNCTNITHWTGTWNITTQDFHSPNASITDSPSGPYNSNANTSTTLNTSVSLVGAAAALLNFWAKWDLEAGYDYVQVKASKDNGSTWIPLTGKFTKPGSANQILGSPVYDGTQLNWMMEEINLQQFVGFNIKLRFTLVSDAYTNGDGFYFDDVTINKVNASGIGINNLLTPTAILSKPIPNPANNLVRMNTSLESGINAYLEIYNEAGQCIFIKPLNEGITGIDIPVSSWANGMYFCRIKGNNVITEFEKFVVAK